MCARLAVLPAEAAERNASIFSVVVLELLAGDRSVVLLLVFLYR